MATTKKGINAFIKTLIKQIRSRQSYGIPVGGSASRLLAEAVLSDADSALADEGFLFTRFVDDYRLFLDSNQSPYSALAFLAEQLATSEGLSLNAQKTKLLKISDFNEFLSSQLVDVSDEAEQSALYQLNHALYFDEEPSQEDIEKLKALNLLDLLKEELSEEMWDFGKIRAIFLGLRLTEDENAADFIVTRLDDLIPFIKEVVLLLHELPQRARFLSEALREAIIAQLKAGPASSVPTIRVWLMELFLRECLEIDHRGLVEIAKDETLSNRHSLIIRGLNNDVNFFRRNKTRFDELNGFEKMAFLMGATCLPKDEFKAWVGAVKSNMTRPLDGLFCNWISSKPGELVDLIRDRGVNRF